MRELHDHYFREAKREGYLSRAAYKLIEIDDKKKVLRSGDRVLDCGCAPGSWLQVASKRVGARGTVVGIDLEPVKLRTASVQAVEGDFTTIDTGSLLALGNHGSGSTAGPSRSANLFDVILSDMAPATTGDPGGDHHRSARLCHALLDRCAELLKPGGNLVMKVFEGEAYPELLKRSATMFDVSRGYKPKASRSESAEMYIVGAGHKPASDSGQANDPVARPKASRSTGWADP
jgi:23S rRNA (uridine2552-2'-O)-methyltransferase